MSKLVMFSMKGCAQCVQAAALLTSKGVHFATSKVDEDADAFSVMQELRLRALPQFFLLEDGGYVYAFDYNKLKSLTDEQLQALK